MIVNQIKLLARLIVKCMTIPHLWPHRQMCNKRLNIQKKNLSSNTSEKKPKCVVMVPLKLSTKILKMTLESKVQALGS